MSKAADKLLAWHSKQSYEFPWRKEYDPYKIWISEIMLQQSQVNVVLPYYNQWMIKFPSIKSLSNAKLDDLLLLWQGLGYYNRVKNIFKTTKILKKDYSSKIPKNYEQLIKLKGIGDYTASAIMAIAFNLKAIPVDGNIRRVIARMHTLSSHTHQIDHIKKYATIYISSENPRISVESLMDLGREVCKPKNPNCSICPLNLGCLSYKNSTTHLYPLKADHKKIPKYNVVVGLIKKKNKFLISKRLKNKFLGGLWELPGGKIKKGESEKKCLTREIKEELDIKVQIKNKLGIVNHQYSHFKVNITLYECNYQFGKAKPLASEEIQWITKNQKNEFAFPSATHKLFEIIKDIK